MSKPQKNLPLADLLAAPLMAAHEARVGIARHILDFILTTGFTPATDGQAFDARTVTFQYDSRIPDAPPGPDGVFPTGTLTHVLPVLAVTEIPSNTIKDVSLDLTLEVAAVTPPAVEGGPAILSGFAHAPDTSAPAPTGAAPRLHITLKAEDVGVPEGLARVLQIMTDAMPHRAHDR